jgi:hypothetical protein
MCITINLVPPFMAGNSLLLNVVLLAQMPEATDTFVVIILLIVAAVAAAVAIARWWSDRHSSDRLPPIVIPFSSTSIVRPTTAPTERAPVERTFERPAERVEPVERSIERPVDVGVEREVAVDRLGKADGKLDRLGLVDPVARGQALGHLMPIEHLAPDDGARENGTREHGTRENGTGDGDARVLDEQDGELPAPDATVRFRRPAEEPVQLLPGRLEVLAGEPQQHEIRFVRIPGEPMQLIVGRDAGPSAQYVALKSSTVSRRHARFAFANGAWSVANLSKTNPVVVNDEQLSNTDGQRTLVDGDRLELGEVVLLFHAR